MAVDPHPVSRAPERSPALEVWPPEPHRLPPARRLTALLGLRRLLHCAAGAPAPPVLRSWRDCVHLADELLLTPALWVVADGRGPQVPPAMRDLLRDAQRSNTVRNVRFRAQLIDSVAALNRHGVTPLLLKGARQLVDGSLGRLGERWLTDLDIAVPSEQFDAARAALREIGYHEMPDPFEHPHELPLMRPRDCGPLELHAEIGSAPLPSVLPLAEAWRDAVPLAVADGHALGLSPAHDVVHNVLHASVQDLNHAVGGLPLRQLVTLTSLVRAGGDGFRWRPVAERFAAHGLADVLRDHVWLAHRFAALPLPPASELGVSSWRRARAHELRVLVGFGLGWPPELHRNLRYAFGAAYLESLYGHGRHPLGVTRNRARHLLTLLRRDGRQALDDALRLRV